MTNENHWEDFSLSNKTAKTGLHYCKNCGCGRWKTDRCIECGDHIRGQVHAP